MPQMRPRISVASRCPKIIIIRIWKILRDRRIGFQPVPLFPLRLILSHKTAQNRRIRLQIVRVVFQLFRQFFHALSFPQPCGALIYIFQRFLPEFTTLARRRIGKKLDPVQMDLLLVTLHIILISLVHRLRRHSKIHPFDIISRCVLHHLPLLMLFQNLPDAVRICLFCIPCVFVPGSDPHPRKTDQRHQFQHHTRPHQQAVQILSSPPLLSHLVFPSFCLRVIFTVYEKAISDIPEQFPAASEPDMAFIFFCLDI